MSLAAVGSRDLTGSVVGMHLSQESHGAWAGAGGTQRLAPWRTRQACSPEPPRGPTEEQIQQIRVPKSCMRVTLQAVCLTAEAGDWQQAGPFLGAWRGMPRWWDRTYGTAGAPGGSERSAALR